MLRSHTRFWFFQSLIWRQCAGFSAGSHLAVAVSARLSNTRPGPGRCWGHRGLLQMSKGTLRQFCAPRDGWLPAGPGRSMQTSQDASGTAWLSKAVIWRGQWRGWWQPIIWQLFLLNKSSKGQGGGWVSSACLFFFLFFLFLSHDLNMWVPHRQRWDAMVKSKGQVGLFFSHWHCHGRRADEHLGQMSVALFT